MDSNLIDENQLLDISIEWNLGDVQSLLVMDGNGYGNSGMENIDIEQLLNQNERVLVNYSTSGEESPVVEMSNSFPATQGKKKRGKPKSANPKNPKNTERCQEQRDKAKVEEARDLQKLEELQIENDMLKSQEEEMRRAIEEIEAIYIDLIQTGQISFT